MADGEIFVTATLLASRLEESRMFSLALLSCPSLIRACLSDTAAVLTRADSDPGDGEALAGLILCALDACDVAGSGEETLAPIASTAVIHDPNHKTRGPLQ